MTWLALLVFSLVGQLLWSSTEEASCFETSSKRSSSQTLFSLSIYPANIPVYLICTYYDITFHCVICKTDIPSPLAQVTFTYSFIKESKFTRWIWVHLAYKMYMVIVWGSVLTRWWRRRERCTFIKCQITSAFQGICCRWAFFSCIDFIWVPLLSWLIKSATCQTSKVFQLSCSRDQLKLAIPREAVSAHIMHNSQQDIRCRLLFSQHLIIHFFSSEGQYLVWSPCLATSEFPFVSSVYAA